MATIEMTVYEVLDAGAYPVKVGEIKLEETQYGPQIAFRFDLVEEPDRYVRAWASAKLSGGAKPSKLYSWTSALLFGGRQLPEGFTLDTDNLLGRSALAVVEVVEKNGMERNRVAQLLPLKPAVRRAGVVVQPEPEPIAPPEYLGANGEVDDLPF